MPFDSDRDANPEPPQPDSFSHENLQPQDSLPNVQSDTDGVVDGSEIVDLEPHVVELPLKYLHVTSLVFDLLAHIRSYLFPIAFGLWGAANGNTALLIVSGILFVPAVARSAFRYFTLRYRIEDAHLVVDQGLIFQKTRTIPVDRIQNIDLTQNVLHRIFKVAEVKVETASGTDAEAVLRVLSMEEVDVLRKAIFAGKTSEVNKRNLKRVDETGLLGEEPAFGPVSVATDSFSADQTVAGHSSGSQSDAKEIWKIPIKDLVKAGLASNRGIVMLGVALVTFDQFTDRGYESVFAFLTDHLPEDTSSQRFYLQAIAATVIGFVLLRLVGIVWYMLRFFDYRLVQHGDDLRLSCGLLTRVSATVPRKRIQFISVQQNLIMRWFKVATIRIETAGGATDVSKPTQSIGKTWFMPVIPESEVPKLVGLLRPDVDWNVDAFDFHGLAPRASTRLMRIGCVQALFFAAAVAVGYCHFTNTFETQALIWGGVAGLIALPALMLFAKKKAVSRKYARLENGIVYRTGVFGRKTSITFFDKLQTVACFESPFDRRWKMATLAIDTAAAGPAGHRIVTKYLDAEFAKSELQALRCLAVEAAS